MVWVIVFYVNYQVNLLFPSALFSISPYDQVPFLGRTKKPMSGLFLKRVICLLSPIIDLYLCLTLKVNFLKDSFLNIYLIIYKIITCFLPYSLVLYRETQLLINWHSFITLSVRHSIRAKKFGLSSVTSARPLTGYGTLDFYTNFRPLVLRETSSTGSRVICLTENNGLSFQVLYPNGLLFELVYRKALF